MLLIGILFCLVSGSSAEDVTIKHVHLIYMNHLDVGFSCPSEMGFLMNVINKYFVEYFPRAIEIARNLTAFGYRERFIYTTHPWLVSLYLDCPTNFEFAGRQLQCPNAQNRTRFIDAVKSGVITWHAGPMNMEFEMMDELMSEFGIQLGIDLDKKLGINRKFRTVSQRDVPGTTVAMVPILKKMGISALSVGVNGATTPAAVPPIFMWNNGNDSLLTFYHPGGYPRPYYSPSEPGGMSKHDCAIIAGLDHALCFAFRVDNRGPPDDYKEVLMTYEIARSQFPGALVNTSTFEEFVALAMPYIDKLPVVTQEMGDVWIQGSASDPIKTSKLRALYRARTKCFREDRCSLDDPRVYNSSRFMLKLAEHTWGSNWGILENIHWTNVEFYKILRQQDNEFYKATVYWEEQRYIIDVAIEALGNHSLVTDIYEEFSKMKPQFPDVDDMKTVDKTSTHQCGDFMLKFNTDGSLVQLKDPTGKNWASVKNPMGKFLYRTYNDSDFDIFFNATKPYSDLFFLGIGKPNMTKNSSPESKFWKVAMESLYTSSDSKKMVAILSLVDQKSRLYYGAPGTVTIEYTCSPTGLDVIVQWFDKLPTRLPEGLDFVFMPVEEPGYKWLMNKIENLVDPLDVVLNGSQRLHAINRGMYYMDNSAKGLEIISPDVAVVNILTESDYVSVIPSTLKPISNMNGVAFNLFNNVWETNFIFWYPYKQEDAHRKCRFTLNFK